MHTTEPHTEPRYALSIDEACKTTGLGRTLIYEEIKEGRLSTLKIGRRRLVPVAALRAWLKSYEEA
jgi:excisionase family DNA binding protein